MQNSLFDESEIQTINVFPTTRYQGSKAKFADWIWDKISCLPFHSVLDAFGGTGSVSYKLKQGGKSVTYNDIMPFNALIGKALIENNSTTLSDAEIDNLVSKHPDIHYPSFISDNFKDIYYTDDENHWLDITRYNIANIKDEYKKAIAWFALFQSCIIKRPYNLFHRKNLYVRLSNVQRSFGNKKTWDTPFETHFRNFVHEANQAVFDNQQRCYSINMNAAEIFNEYDLVYIDTPYLNEKGVGVDYEGFYHFLNGLVNYDNWGSLIDYNSKHHRIKKSYSVWNDKQNILNGFADLIRNYHKSILVFSYRSNGIPSIDELLTLLQSFGRINQIYYSHDIKYALSETKSKEIIIISQPKQ